MDFDRVQRVLIYRLGSLGDTVVAVPSFHLIERTFPNAQRVLLTNLPVHSKAPAAFGVLNGSGLVHDFINYPIATRTVAELARVWRQIRQFRPQVVVYLTQRRAERDVRRDRWFFRLCGVRHVIGLPVGDLNESLYDAANDRWEYEAARLLRCLADLGQVDPFDLVNWDLRLTMAEEKKAKDLLARLPGTPLIACGPGTKMQAKDWGEENWRALLTKLSGKMPRHGLILVGAEEDATVADYVGSEWRGPVVNLCGALTPRETAAVLQYTELFLGPDSGPMHLAAAYGVPCAIPFSARMNPGPWFPIGTKHRVVYHRVVCQNCVLETCIEKKKVCLTSITVDEMFTAALEAWNNEKMRTAVAVLKRTACTS